MSSKKCCRYCLEADPAMVRSLDNGSHSVEISGCSTCHKRHEKEVAALKTEVASLKAVVARRKQRQQTEMMPSIEAEPSHAKKRTCEDLQSEINRLKAARKRQRKKVEFLKLHLDSVMMNELQCLRCSSEEIPYYPLVGKSPLIQKFVIGGYLGPEESLMDVTNGARYDISTEAFEGIVKFCNTGEYTFSEVASPGEVLRVAHGLEIGFLKELCEAELCRDLSPENVREMLELSRKYESRKLRKATKKVFNEHFDMLTTKVHDIVDGSAAVSESKAKAFLDRLFHKDN
ncbi:unnamed protein product [Calypogeia fissa]